MSWKAFLIFWFSKTQLRHTCIGIVAFLCLITSILWVLDSSGNYEPIIVFLGALLTVLLGLPSFVVYLQEAKAASSDCEKELEIKEVSGLAVCRALETMGFELKMQIGSHALYENNGLTVTVPATSRCLHVSAIKSIAKQALLASGKSQSIFVSLIKNA